MATTMLHTMTMNVATGDQNQNEGTGVGFKRWVVSTVPAPCKT